MKFGVVNKSTILNRFVLHSLQRNITHLAVITRKTNIKLVILKGGELEKSQLLLLWNPEPYGKKLRSSKHYLKEITEHKFADILALCEFY